MEHAEQIAEMVKRLRDVCKAVNRQFPESPADMEPNPLTLYVQHDAGIEMESTFGTEPIKVPSVRVGYLVVYPCGMEVPSIGGPRLVWGYLVEGMSPGRFSPHWDEPPIEPEPEELGRFQRVEEAVSFCIKQMIDNGINNLLWEAEQPKQPPGEDPIPF